MARSENPIFVVGTERSGTNLVRTLISRNDAVANITPSQVFANLYELLSSYDWSEEQRFRRLVTWMCRAINAARPSSRRFDIDSIVDAVDSRCFFAVYDYLHQEEAAEQGCERWVTKDLSVHELVGPVTRYFDDPSFVWVVRDPRDVALSMIRSRIHPNNVYYAAKRWAEEQQAMLSLARTQEIQDCVHMIRYRDLLRQPATEMRNICDVAGMQYDEQMIHPEDSDTAEDSVHSWQNIGKPIMRNNYGKWQENLSGRDIETVEAICGDLMSGFGYRAVLSDPYLPVLRKQGYRVHEYIWRFLIKYGRLSRGADPAEVHRVRIGRQRIAAIREEIIEDSKT